MGGVNVQKMKNKKLSKKDFISMYAHIFGQ